MDSCDTEGKCYNVTNTKHGLGVIANRAIRQGEVIFSEDPWVWSANSVDGINNYCFNCGIVIDPSTTFSCKCNLPSCVHFCSSECLLKSESQGHMFLCPCFSGEMKEQLLDLDPRGHLLLALKVYAKIAIHFIAKRLQQNILDAGAQIGNQSEDIETISANVVKGFHSEDWCHTKHAVRTGQWELLDKSLFDNLIAPAYFDGHLKGPLEAFKQIFSGSNHAWLHYASINALPPPPPTTSTSSSNPHIPDISSLVEEFTSSNIFGDTFLRKIMGTFVVNNLTIFSPADSTNIQGENKNSTTSQSLLPLRGSGLYSIYSKMNHSCVCNTTNESRLTKVTVIASRDIAAQEEITTTYLHVADASTLSYRKRNKQLVQYLFSCSCELCESQAENSDCSSDSDSDNDDDDADD